MTQQFCSFMYKRLISTAFLVLLPVILLVSGCALDEPLESQSPARTPANAKLCDASCTGTNMGCFELESGCEDASCVGCFEINCPPENPVQSCTEGAICKGGQCMFPNTCAHACTGDTHCAGGSCIPDYTPDNVCSPLAQCRNHCASAGPGCVNACEHDRSATCSSCLQDMQRCEGQNSCTASATGCCNDLYCQCFPESPGCDGVPCKACLDQCQDADNPTDCFNTCAGNSAKCSTCIQPFVNNPDCTTPTPTDTCKDVWKQCTGEQL